MTDPTSECPSCGKSVAADDQYCSRCGLATRWNNDPNATVMLGAGVAEARASGSHRALPEEGGLAEAPSSATFRDRFQQVVNAEYQILSLLGQGGFARVYKARDRRLGRIVAIKVIRPDVAGAELFVETFRKEGIALAKLRHPAIIPIHDIREREGLIYYVMPYVEGTTLEAKMERGKIPPYESRRILSEVAQALSVAHKAKIAHLDIKPANVFLEGDLQRVLLMDFGAALAVKDVVDDSAEGGPVVGTPEYMSPEQAQGLNDIDHRSDIYSLGALGYHMLLGRPPFSGKNTTEVLEKHVKQAPRPIRDINPSIPKEFADALMKCLTKDPWGRFSTAKELDAALQSVTFRSTQELPSRASQELKARTSQELKARTSQELAVPRIPASGVRGAVVAIIAGVALIIGLLAGLSIG